MKKILLLLSTAACLQLRSANTEPASQTLHLSYLNLKTIELDSGRASTLVSIDVSGNPISSLPASIAFAKDLKTLKLNSCRNIDWNSLVPLLSKLPIEELQLDNCDITYLPMELTGMKTLKKLSLKNNGLQEIPWNLCYNENLEYLNLENNGLIELTKDVQGLKNLRYLNVSGNPCINEKKFWETIGTLNRLESFICKGLQVMPAEISLPPALSDLCLDNCKAAFPEKISGAADLKKLSLLSYNQTDIKKVFAALGQNRLNELSISGTFISCIPEHGGLLDSLTNLSIDAFSLNTVCDLGTLKKLQEVKLKASDSASVSKFLAALGTGSPVVQLDLSGSPLKTLPKETGSLKKLRKLSVRNSTIGSIGHPSICKNLEELDLRGNKQLPEEEVQACKAANPALNLFYDFTAKGSKVSYIKKPFPELELPAEFFSINTKRDTLIKTANGTRISIPASSLVDKNNKPLTQPVKLSYSTYYDPLEVFASGIPMTADSAGVKKSFASAGMFALNASYGDNQPAFVKKGKEIKVDFVSSNPNKSYNYWYLDTVRQNWVQTGKDSIDDTRNLKRAFTKQYPAYPRNPYRIYLTKLIVSQTTKKSRNVTPRFTLAAKTSYNRNDTLCYNPTELKTFGSQEWEFAGTDVKQYYNLFDEKKFFYKLKPVKKLIKLHHQRYTAESMEGIEVRINPDQKNDCYNLVFYSDLDSVSIPVIPAITENDPEKIQKRNFTIYTKYDQAFKENKTTRSARTANFNKEYDNYRRSMNNYNLLLKAFNDPRVSAADYQKMVEALNRQELDSLATMAVSKESIMRSMALTGFGTYNCDYFSRINNPIVCNPTFRNKETNEKMYPESVTLIDLSENAFVQTIPGNLKLAPNHNYWIFTESRKGAIGFATLPATSSEIESIVVKPISASSMKELREQLKY